jgi:type II secretory pathway component PulK
MSKNNFQYQKGQTLVLLLVFVMVTIAITTAAAFVIATNSLSATNVSLGLATKQMAEAGAEKALLALLRDPSYRGETFSLDTGSVTATVSGTTNLTIDVEAKNGDFVKRVEVTATYSNNVLTPVSWKDLN